MEPETRYAKTRDGIHIAYQVRGEGPIDLAFIMGFAANFEVELEDANTGRFVDRLAESARVILFDKRGTGLSDRQQTPDLELRAEDLRAVLDTVGSERAALFGHSEGGALGAFFAATHPDRVSALPLYGAAARYAWAPDYPLGMKRDEFEAERAATAKDWGTIEHARSWMEEEAPSLVSDPEAVRLWAKMERYAASPGAALEFMDNWYATDVRSVLGTIQAPTLVLCRPATEWLENSQYLAARIPGAKLVALSGSDYTLAVGDIDEPLKVIRDFLGSISAEQAEIDRVLATVLFTDIVGSTEKAASLRGSEWKELLETPPSGGPRAPRPLPGTRGRHGGRRVLRDVRRSRASRALRARDRGCRQTVGARSSGRPSYR